MNSSNVATDWEGFCWRNAPPAHAIKAGGVSLLTGSKTDFWQRTHYGFQRDNGHCLLKRLSGDFTLQVRTAFEPNAQYDQCGLLARIDTDNWIKCSMEYETPHLSRLGSVVTNFGFSDWASQDIDSAPKSMWYRMSGTGQDFLLEASPDGNVWQQLRVTHMHSHKDTIDAGIYACSPVGHGFPCAFDNIRIGPSEG